MGLRCRTLTGADRFADARRVHLLTSGSSATSELHELHCVRLDVDAHGLDGAFSAGISSSWSTPISGTMWPRRRRACPSPRRRISPLRHDLVRELADARQRVDGFFHGRERDVGRLAESSTSCRSEPLDVRPKAVVMEATLSLSDDIVCARAFPYVPVSTRACGVLFQAVAL